MTLSVCKINGCLSGGSRICQRGRTMASALCLNGGLGPPARPRGRAPGGGTGFEAFCTFYTKKRPKVKDVGENLPPCLSRAAMTSPKFWSMGGGGRPVRP